MEWNDDIIVRLRSLWAEGHSTAEIGRRIAVSKNAVVGKAHRLGLAARPSPIRRDGPAAISARPQQPRRVVGPTLPPLVAAEMTETHQPLPRRPAQAAIAPAQRPTVAAAPPPLVRAVPASRPIRHSACCWPLGEPGTKSFRFCDVDALHGKPYCSEHAQLAYVRVRERRDDAA
jgi:GcrA cell cycle regulator